MFFVSKGKEQVKVPTRDDAVALVNSLNELDCTHLLSKQELIGTPVKSDSVYELSYKGYTVRIVDAENTLKVIGWLFELKCGEFSCEEIPYEDNIMP